MKQDEAVKRVAEQLLSNDDWRKAQAKAILGADGEITSKRIDYTAKATTYLETALVELALERALENIECEEKRRKPHNAQAQPGFGMPPPAAPRAG